MVVNMLVTKVCNNMKFWASNKEAISKSLNVFSGSVPDMVVGALC